MRITYRELAVRTIAGWVGIHEEGGNNAGAFVEMVQRADGLAGEHYAWCQSLQNAAHRIATGGEIVRRNGRLDIQGGMMLAQGTASVGFFVDYARRLGWVVTRPLRGDRVAFQFTSDNWPDHVGIIERVLRLGPVLILQTLEGNTSPEAGGSQDDGDGVYRRRRVVRASRVIFVRVPGEREVIVPPPPVKPAIPKGGEWWWAWADWHRRGRKGTRPSEAPRRIPVWAWRRLVAWNLRHPVKK